MSSAPLPRLVISRTNLSEQSSAARETGREGGREGGRQGAELGGNTAEMSTTMQTDRAADADQNVLEVTPLGAGNEVGRSCIVASFR